MIDVGRDFERMRDYVVGRLSDEERRTFEDRLVRDPELVREFERSLQLREGLYQLRAQGYFDRSAARPTRSRNWLPALAAAALAGIALLLWVQPRTGPAPILTASFESRAAGAAPAVTAHFTFVSMRAASRPELEHPGNGLIEFRAAPGMSLATSRYRVTLIHEDDGAPSQPVGSLTDLAVGPDGYLHFYADAARLAPGSYALHVESDAAGAGAAQTFGFSLRARAAP